MNLALILGNAIALPFHQWVLIIHNIDSIHFGSSFKYYGFSILRAPRCFDKYQRRRREQISSSSAERFDLLHYAALITKLLLPIDFPGFGIQMAYKPLTAVRRHRYTD